MNLSGLLFLHGHIADAALGSALATPAASSAPSPRSAPMDLFKSVMYLGGRPMHAGHNYDLEEPFEPEFGNRVATRRVFGALAPVATPDARPGHRAAPRVDERARRLAAAGCG